MQELFLKMNEMQATHDVYRAQDQISFSELQDELHDTKTELRAWPKLAMLNIGNFWVAFWDSSDLREYINDTCRSSYTTGTLIFTANL